MSDDVAKIIAGGKADVNPKEGPVRKVCPIISTLPRIVAVPGRMSELPNVLPPRGGAAALKTFDYQPKLLVIDQPTLIPCLGEICEFFDENSKRCSQRTASLTAGLTRQPIDGSSE